MSFNLKSLWATALFVLASGIAVAQDTQVCIFPQLDCFHAQEVVYHAPSDQSPIKWDGQIAAARLSEQTDKCRATKITVEGHASFTDNQDAANLDLEGHLNSIWLDLTNAGFSPDIIEIQNLGTSDPFVKTPQGVYDQLNSRIEILVQFERKN